VSVQTRKVETVSVLRADNPYPAMLLIGRLDAGVAGLASFDFQTIPDVYSKLVIDLCTHGTKQAFNAYIKLNFNNDFGANYDYNCPVISTIPAMTGFSGYGAAYMPVGIFPAASAPANEYGAIFLNIINYSSANVNKTVIGNDYWKQDALSTAEYQQLIGGNWRSTAPVNRITLTPDSGTFVQYSTARLYGVY
jgi:hypothetical protein